MNGCPVSVRATGDGRHKRANCVTSYDVRAGVSGYVDLNSEST